MRPTIKVKWHGSNDPWFGTLKLKGLHYSNGVTADFNSRFIWAGPIVMLVTTYSNVNRF